MNLRKFISGVSAFAIAASAFAAMTITASADTNTQVWNVADYKGESHVSLSVSTFYYGSDNTFVDSAESKVTGTDYIEIHTGSGSTRGVITSNYDAGFSSPYIKLGQASNSSDGYIAFTPSYTGTVEIKGAYFNNVGTRNGITNYATANTNKTITGNCVAGTEVKLYTSKNFIVQTITVTETEAKYVGTSWNFAGYSNSVDLAAGKFYKIATDGIRFTEKTEASTEWTTGVLYVKPTSDTSSKGQIGVKESNYASALKVRGDFEIDYTPEKASYVTITCNYNNAGIITDYVKVDANPSSTVPAKKTTLTYYVPAKTRLQITGPESSSSNAVSISKITVTEATEKLTQLEEQFDSDVAGDNVKAKAATYTTSLENSKVSVGIGSKIQTYNLSNYQGEGDAVIGIIMKGTSTKLPGVGQMVVVVE